uniref:Tape measure protein n=1 Tax=Streptomyces phage Abafar TaxID=3158855 RepID=A0AAU7GXW3_9CAUD
MAGEMPAWLVAASSTWASLQNATLPGSVDPGSALQVQLKALQAQQKSYQSQLSKAKAALAKLKKIKKPTAAQKRQIAMQTASIKRLEASLKSTTTKLTTVQNKYYESTGQYDKLLTGENRDAFMALNSLFKQYGLESLAGKIYEYVKNGYGADTISILLQDTPEYKKRFAANEARLKAGLSVLSPAEYIAVENSYRQIMRQSGLPVGFYDSNDDFTNWISSDMSPTELQGRVDLATQATALANPAYKAALKQMGLDDGQLAAYFLDPDRALPILQKSAATAAIGAEALQRGLAFDQQYASELATAGVSRDQAAQGYAKIADEFSDLGTLAQIYGGQWTQRMAEEDVFVGGTGASQQREKLIGRERGSFSGGTGGARAGLAQRGGAR